MVWGRMGWPAGWSGLVVMDGSGAGAGPWGLSEVRFCFWVGKLTNWVEGDEGSRRVCVGVPVSRLSGVTSG